MYLLVILEMLFRIMSQDQRQIYNYIHVSNIFS